ncbi:MAG: TrmH family RNA methyltransferase [Candidatus Zambryskibacteria bacterium]|nr:TrmH family RNA methyltransferase [Candidatus Zambryskibacteria bacterium]
MQKQIRKKKVAVLLHNIRSVHNVGSIFRTADALGVNKIYLSGYTPAPLDRFNRPRKDITKVALGAEKIVAWEHTKDPIVLIRKLKESHQIIALEQTENSVDYKKVKVLYPVLFIIGNEVEGVEKSILKLCDIIAEIPMRGKLARNRLPDDVGKESLNVSVAFGIALSRIVNI